MSIGLMVEVEIFLDIRTAGLTMMDQGKNWIQDVSNQEKNTASVHKSGCYIQMPPFISVIMPNLKGGIISVLTLYLSSYILQGRNGCDI